MATLTRQSDSRSVRLGGTTTVGRTPTCDLTLPDPLVSGIHARISFRHGIWSVDDLRSRNGTLINGKPLRRDKPQPLKKGDVITFGVNHQQWQVTDLAAPALFARSAEGNEVSGDELLALPDEDNPTVSIYQRADGRWVAERAGEMDVVDDGHDIAIDGLTWRVHLPNASDETMENVDFAPSPEDISLHFAVSTDEEHVELEARVNNRSYDLKARTHHYFLLTLARARLSDAEDPELPPTSHGWLYQDDLSRMLRMDDNAIYLAAFRARQQLKKAGITRSAGLIERRSGTRQLRIGVANLHVRVI